MKFKLKEEFHPAITLDELKSLGDNIQIIYSDGNFIVNTKEGYKKIPEMYRRYLEDAYREFKCREANPKFDRKKAADERNKKIETSFKKSQLIDKTKKELASSEKNKYGSKVPKKSEDNSVECVDMGTIGNFGELAKRLSEALTNMMLTRLEEVKNKVKEDNFQPYDVAVADASGGSIMLPQENEVEEKALEEIRDEAVFVKIYMDKSGSFSGDKSDFSNEIYKKLLGISKKGLVSGDKVLLNPNKLNVSLCTFNASGLRDIPTHDAQGKELSDKSIIAQLALGSGNDGHSHVFDEVHKTAAVGVAKNLENVMLITDGSGASGEFSLQPVEVNGIVWHLFVDTYQSDYVENIEADTQDMMYGKYGTYLYNFLTR